MKLNQILIHIFFLLSGSLIVAQNNESTMDDRARIPLTSVLMPQAEQLSGSAAQNLLSKLQRAANENGMGATAESERFLLVANVNVITKDITATAPPMVSMSIDLDLVIVDYLTKQTFSSVSIPLKGAGQNETKAIIQALRALNESNSDLQQCLAKGKTRIIEYYKTQCDFLIKEAQTLASMQQFEAAIAKLIGVPEVCKDCYFNSMDAAGEIFDQYQDFLCEQNLAKAKSIWIANPNSQGANAMAAYLSQLLPNAACYAEAEALIEEVRSKVLQDEQRNWDFRLKTWDDSIDLEEQRVEAFRSVGISYGENQPDTSLDLNFIRF